MAPKRGFALGNSINQLTSVSLPMRPIGQDAMHLLVDVYFDMGEEIIPMILTQLGKSFHYR